ncbi:MAG: tripartite tricarboxylate transporter TctB family protein [Desulfarculus sp.]|jgi:phosphatidylserine synthase|nr:MAG: tripartite tricarboxylate transporter TctB family protein [Desulfarculus sp.]
MNRDALVGLVCLAASVVLYATLGHIEEPRAAAFPRTIIVIMGALSALLFLQHLIFPKPRPQQPPFPWLRVGGLFAIIVIYLVVCEELGFYLSAFLFFLAVTYIMGWRRLNPKQAAKWLMGSAIFTGILYVLFKVILEVQTPRGLLL